jgi:hypothetical protein
VALHRQWNPGHDDDTVIEVSEREFLNAARAALEALGLTYAELQEQALRRDFTSSRAHALWVAIGGTVDL